MYGLVAPASSLSAYRGGSCVTGQSYVADDPKDASSRVGSGVGFVGEDSAWTLAHELGHMDGREHAPCDTSQWDAGYPYKGDALGVAGLDQRTHALIPASGATDLMGYCDPLWISDYTYSALFDRVLAVSGEKALSWRPTTTTTWAARVDEEADGTLTWSPPRLAARWAKSSPGRGGTRAGLPRGGPGQARAARPRRRGVDPSVSTAGFRLHRSRRKDAPASLTLAARRRVMGP